ncbi:hypothetical protein Sru01_04280 [Sphaerisporangium rufum]|uniref:Uncharacterized protein n=1 Tax=Sphaerisporangium rufum TaxID=1381558 RepID=A0A919UVW2_9ACTN|nr:hypothetical protein Sru01_04280 [Sphaerisporangium rufum]
MMTEIGGQTGVAGPVRGESGNSFMAALTLLYERVGTATHGRRAASSPVSVLGSTRGARR